MKRIDYTLWILIFGCWGVCSANGQITCPVLSGGGTLHSDGTVLVLGQFATGIVAGTVDATEQGAVPCWFDLSSCVGDIDSDNDIDLQDLATLLAHFGASGATLADGDLDGDGDVDLQDLATMLSVYGSNCP